jgi:hypothetical protein
MIPITLEIETIGEGWKWREYTGVLTATLIDEFLIQEWKVCECELAFETDKIWITTTIIEYKTGYFLFIEIPVCSERDAENKEEYN